MENVHAERSAGWSVFCYVAVLVVATFFNGGLPPLGSRPDEMAIAIDTHHFNLLLGAWLTFPATGFFLWFLVGLRSYLGHAVGRQEGLPTFAFGSGLVLATTSLIAAALLVATVDASPDSIRPNGIAALYSAFVFIQGGLGYAPVSIFLFACAHSMRRHQRAPSWLAWLGYIAALGAAIGTLSIFLYDPFMALGGPGPGLFGALPAAIWLIATGVVLVSQNNLGSSDSSTSAAS
jgi:hypothetical protein